MPRPRPQGRRAGVPRARWRAAAAAGSLILAAGLAGPAQAAPPPHAQDGRGGPPSHAQDGRGGPPPHAKGKGVSGPTAAGPVVRTEQGPVRGTVLDGYRLFQGIPYAADPVGDLRFAAPQPASAHRGVLDATQPGDQCAQLRRVTNPETFAEDCLNLNVTTPAGLSADRTDLPVMVWIHGGAWVYGTGADYDASKLALEGDVVVVTINYRLGPLGFLNHPSLPANNLALLDQQAALRWVQENIAAFGGDPDNVTIAGESAGAMSVCAQVASPSAAGLFDKAIAQSLSCTATLTTLEASEATGERVAAAVGCTDPATVLACLRAVPAEQLLRAWVPIGGAFVAGGPELPLQPREAFLTGQYNRVPMIMGNNLDELRLYVPITFGADAVSMTAERYEQIIRARFGAGADAVLALYPAEDYDAPVYALGAVLSDYGSTLSTCSHLDAYEVLSDALGPLPVYAYQFQDRTASPLIEVPGYDEGAEHAVELPYLFPNLFGEPLDEAQQRLSTQMVRYWTNFMRTGDPNGPAVPTWPAFTDSGDVLALALPEQGGIRPVDVAETSHCDFWSAFPRAF